jgi:hypothetical protein
MKNVGRYPGTYNIYMDFNDLASSWYNKSTSYDARWFWDINGTGTSRCMNSQSFSNQITGADNDEASSVIIYTDALAC